MDVVEVTQYALLVCERQVALFLSYCKWDIHKQHHHQCFAYLVFLRLALTKLLCILYYICTYVHESYLNWSEVISQQADNQHHLY